MQELNQKIMEQVNNTLPWGDAISAALIGTVFLLGVSIIFFGGYTNRPQRGAKFKSIMFATFVLLTFAFMPKTDLKTYEGIQFVIKQFFFIFGLSIFLYETIGTYVLEKKVVPWVLSMLGITYKIGAKSKEVIKVEMK